MEENTKSKLSKAVLDMKFMKRTKDRVEKEADAAEGQAMYSLHITEDMKKSGDIIFIDASLTHCIDLMEGRFSFGGMNPDLERLMANKYQARLEEWERAKEKDISDVEMAKGYSTLVDTMGKKFQKKNQRNTHNKKFLKPAPL